MTTGPSGPIEGARRPALAVLPTPAIARRLRVEAGLSQEALAAQVPCSSKALAHWEAGRCSPNDLMRVKYLRALRRVADEGAL